MDTDADRQKLELLRKEIQKGIDQLEAGEVSQLAMDDIRRIARERAEKGA